MKLKHEAQVEKLVNEDPTAMASEVQTLKFEPGTLSLFRGSGCLHRVTECVGPRPRFVAIFSFATRPGFKNSADVQKLFWGKSMK